MAAAEVLYAAMDFSTPSSSTQSQQVQGQHSHSSFQYMHRLYTRIRQDVMVLYKMVRQPVRATTSAYATSIQPSLACFLEILDIYLVHRMELWNIVSQSVILQTKHLTTCVQQHRSSSNHPHHSSHHHHHHHHSMETVEYDDTLLQASLLISDLTMSLSSSSTWKTTCPKMPQYILEATTATTTANDMDPLVWAILPLLQTLWYECEAWKFALQATCALEKGL